MKYLLFINFSSGLMHNSIYGTLSELHESVAQLIKEEQLEIKKEILPNIGKMKRHLQENDDYFKALSNDTWYHIQPFPVFG